MAAPVAGDKMVTPLVKVKSLKKYTKRFKRHQCDRRITVGVSRAGGGHSGGMEVASRVGRRGGAA
jgi:hypothetical protein